MIRPLIPMAMRGVIWYQGESNESAPEYYERLMRDLIADWRFRWGQGDFPFLQVLLAGFRNPADYDDAAAWPYIREAQSRAAQATGNLACVCAGPWARLPIFIPAARRRSASGWRWRRWNRLTGSR